MSLGDPFDTTYAGSFKGASALGNGIESAGEDIAKNIDLQNNRKKSFDMLKQFGMINTKTEDPTLDQLAQGAKDFAKSQGHELNINYGDNQDQAKQNIMGIYKALNIPMPQGKTTTELNLSPGTKYDPVGGKVLFSQPNKTESMASQVSAMKEQDKKENAKLIADGIENGNQLADFQSLYGLAGPVKAELQKRGVNVNKMQLDTLAEKKFVQTLNGPQQTRLRQLIPSVTDGLDILEGLNQEFKRTGIKGFNKAQIEGLANGGGTPEQQQLAQRFVTQINTLKDEMGGVFMGGNTPTDKAIELAGGILSSDFNDTSLSSAIKQLKVNLNIRKAAMENVGAVGINGPINQNAGQQVLQASGMQSQPQSKNQSKSVGKYTLVQ